MEWYLVDPLVGGEPPAALQALPAAFDKITILRLA